MEKQKQKISGLLKKMSGRSFRTTKQSSSDIKHLTAHVSPKQTIEITPLKQQSIKNNTFSQSNSSHSGKYIMNKTTTRTPQDKSAMMSYISTPNQNSMGKNKLRKFKSNRNITMHSKIFDMVYAHQNDQIQLPYVNIEFFLGKKKLGERSFYGVETIQSLKDYMVNLIKNEKGLSKNYYGMAGFNPIPYNHAIKAILNTKNGFVSELTNKNVKSLVVQPILLGDNPSFENMKLSDFEILKHLGSGGFSNVYLAKYRIDQKLCALKFIKKQTITSAKKAKMLENEKDILFTIDSPNLVDILYAFQTPNYIVFGLQYCENGNLYNFLQKNRRISEVDAWHIFKQILEGLDYLHQNNILFRDLKLENILFDEKGKLKITDFGLSKPEVSENDITYSYCGSPEYMAPEMLAKCGHSLKVDYYALGILLYELLYGVSPFYAHKKEDIFMAIMSSEPKFPKQIPISKEVKEFIKGLLTKNPDHRIGSLKGIKQIKTHPWVRNPKSAPSSVLDFNYEALKISTKQVKQIQQKFRKEIEEFDDKKFFFPKSFVNKKLIDDLVQNLVTFTRKKEKSQKMNRLGLKTKFSKRG